MILKSIIYLKIWSKKNKIRNLITKLTLLNSNNNLQRTWIITLTTILSMILNLNMTMATIISKGIKAISLIITTWDSLMITSLVKTWIHNTKISKVTHNWKNLINFKMKCHKMLSLFNKIHLITVVKDIQLKIKSVSSNSKWNESHFKKIKIYRMF